MVCLVLVYTINTSIHIWYLPWGAVICLAIFFGAASTNLLSCAVPSQLAVCLAIVTLCDDLGWLLCELDVFSSWWGVTDSIGSLTWVSGIDNGWQNDPRANQAVFSRVSHLQNLASLCLQFAIFGLSSKAYQRDYNSRWVFKVRTIMPAIDGWMIISM